MKRALFVLATLVAVGCGVDPVADCESQCMAAVENGCRPAATTDCMADCAGFQAIYDRDRANSVTAQCEGEFDSLYGCTASGDPCDTSRCQAEVTASTQCFAEFCAARPTTPVCSGMP